MKMVEAGLMFPRIFSVSPACGPMPWVHIHSWAEGHSTQKSFGQILQIERIQEVKFEGDVYLSLDMDCLDPAFAPGVSHYEPGGLSTREILGWIQNIGGNLVGADLVEFNPERDPSGLTAMVVAKLLKEILGRMLSDGSPEVE